MAGISPNWNALYSNQGIRLQGNPALDDLRQRYATQQAQKAQDNANFTSQIAKLNFGGAKDADLDYLHKQYGDILNTFGQLRNTNDPKQRAQLGLQLQQKQNGFLYDIEKSKDANKQAMDATNLLHNPNADLTDDAPNKILALHGKSSFDKDYQDVYNNTMTGLFNPKTVDLSKLSLDAFNGVKDTSKSTGQPIKDTTTGEYKTPVYNSTTAKKDDFTKTLLTKIHGTKGADKQIAKSYPGMEIGQATEQFINDAWATHQNKLGTDTTYSQPFESFGQKEALQTHGAIVRQQYPSGAANQVTPFQQSAAQLQAIGQKNEIAARDMVKPLIDIIPTKGLRGNINYTVSNGKVIIDIPRKHISNTNSVPAHRIEVDIADPNFGATLQAKIAQEGANVNGFNQSYKGKKIPSVTEVAPKVKTVRGTDQSVW